ncbi:conserved hypothetical protein [Candidatus Methylobacter favarea]|uniref:Uncharacterized protein n=1 Tax=Candidatus Methylobacter favarea TaxID=2707345 RepID=A0A8S0YAQ9_9GAMM|nr:hypothetical protein [Candidatus Methylobacter favarea]CAA9892387.1 conserved hypothetical protein [Candidatus Methylobacter favarea]
MGNTFCEVNDASIIDLIGRGLKRIVLIAPGVSPPVAKALGQCFDKVEKIAITVVIDPDEDVYRLGYGDADGLKQLYEFSQKTGFALMSQTGLRLGILLVDDLTLVWSPTARSVEAAPGITVAEDEAVFSRDNIAPNGLLLGQNPGEQLANAVAADGTKVLPANSEIGRCAVTHQQVQQTLIELEKNPPIPVDLARITRVFSTKLQFVELKVTKARLSRSQLTISNKHLNADIQGELQGLIDSKLRAFSDFRDEEVEVPAFMNGEPVFDREGKPLTEPVSEASLERLRNGIERRYIYNISSFGWLISKDDKIEFEKQINAYEEQLKAHSQAIRDRIDKQAEKIIQEAVAVIMNRAERTGAKFDPEILLSELRRGLDRNKGESPQVTLVFKDVTYEQTKNESFREKVDKALPKHKLKQLGRWSEYFDAAKASQESKTE